MKMFSCSQEIALLHSSLLSAQSSVLSIDEFPITSDFLIQNSGCLFDCDDVELPVKNLYKFVKDIIHYKSHIKEEKENVKTMLHISEKIHAAMFFTVLRSHGITSNEATTFYGSIIYNWPTVNFKLYLELNFKCDWSEYFIKCASQLPVNALCKVLNSILNISSSTHLKYYSWHLILQTVIFKVIEVPDCDKKDYPFDFDFIPDDFTAVKDEVNAIMDEAEDSVAERSDENDESSTDTVLIKISKSDIVLLRELFNNICNCISGKMKESSDLEVLKIVLHAAKSLLKGLFYDKLGNLGKISQFSDLLNIFSLFKDCFALDVNEKVLKTALQHGFCSDIEHAYATCSWNIPLEYLLFLLSYYHKELCSSFSSELLLPEKVKSVYSKVIDVVEYGTQLSSIYLNASSPGYDEFIKMLCKIIQFGFEGQSFAAELIFLDSVSIEKNDVILVLEENSHVIKFECLYAQVIDSIKKVKSQESKLMLLKILYKLLKECGTEIYNTVLDYILTIYGTTDEFKLPDFDKKFLQFTRETPTLKELEEVFPELLLQDPMNVLKYVIDQALIEGSEGKKFIQILQHFPSACLYSTSDDLPTLHGILNEYFETKCELQAYAINNMVKLYQFLIEVHLEKPILLPNAFFSKCIIPKLLSNEDKIFLILECSHVLIPSLLSNNTDMEVIMSLIISLGQLVDQSVKTGHGKFKSLALSLLKPIEMYQIENNYFKDEEKFRCLSSISELKFNEMTYVYLKEFLPKNIDLFSSKEFIWVLCCKNEDSSFFQDKFFKEKLSYPELLNILVKVLPHLTKEEWLYSYHLVKECCIDDVLRNEIIGSFINLFQLSEAESITYAVIACFTASLKFILNNKMSDPSFVISCFSNSLIDFVNEGENARTVFIILIFLDLCYLLECISPEFIQAFIAVLLELKKLIMNTTSTEDEEKHCRKLLCDAALCLPDMPEKMILYQKLSIIK